jgi:7-cyano-7-deazaguanine reductase
MTENIYQSLKQLGENTSLPDDPKNAVLEKVKNPKPDFDYMVRFTCPEFTSICPITSQPDFAHIVIDYVPDEFLVESKSLKLFLSSFRNHGAFHEACTLEIAERIMNEISPKWFRIGGYWYPRGGIPIDIFYQSAEKPTNIWIADQEVPSYRGR